MGREIFKTSAGSLDSRDIERLAGEMIVAGFDGSGRSPPERIERWLVEDEIAGVILFARNIESVDQVRELNQRIRETGNEVVPPLVSVDQEGGRVMRVRDGFSDVPAMWELWREGGERAVAEASKTIADELTGLGFNLNYAPVLDVRTNPDNDVIGDRAFSDKPEEVGRAARVFIEAHRSAGVLTCGKHFPGHGDTMLDSHEELPVVDHDLERLRRIEFPPFDTAIAAGVPMVMTAHILARQIDAESPATLSRSAIDLLREELGFEGVVVSDDVEMKALADRYSPEEIANKGLDAGIDLFLVCHSVEKVRRVREALVERALEDPEARSRLLESARRVDRLRRSIGQT